MEEFYRSQPLSFEQGKLKLNLHIDLVNTSLWPGMVGSSVPSASNYLDI